MGLLEKAKTPQKTDSRLKLLLYGTWNTGKTMAAIQFPNSLIIDAEHSTDNYYETIAKMGSKVIQTNSYEDAKQIIRELRTTKHAYKTLIIDPVTMFNQDCREVWLNKFRIADKKNTELDDFGVRYWGKVKSDWNSFYRELHKLDMNVIVTAHQKDKYSDGGDLKKIGYTFDSDTKADGHAMVHVMRIEKRGMDRVVITEKQRVDVGKKSFPDEYLWKDIPAIYQYFKEFMGSDDLEKESTPVVLASAEQVSELIRLTKLLNTDEDLIRKWLKKADAENFSDMTSDQINACINFLKKQIEPEGDK